MAILGGQRLSDRFRRSIFIDLPKQGGITSNVENNNIEALRRLWAYMPWFIASCFFLSGNCDDLSATTVDKQSALPVIPVTHSIRGGR
jgi:hypothetical protein